MNKFFLLIALFFQVSLTADSQKPVEIAVVVASYNNGSSNHHHYLKNLQSLADQTYPYFVVYYTNDCSTDDTGALVDAFVKSHHLENKFVITHNTVRKGSVANTYNMIHQVDPHTVIVILDGDDALAHQGVLQRIADVYKDPQVWLTYGNYKTFPFRGPRVCALLPERVMKERSFRSYRWVTSHLRSFYAGLFHKIKKEDLFYEGEFFSKIGDLPVMFPMLEMASLGHIKFIPDILYLWNYNNPISDYRSQHALARKMEKFIRAASPYEPLQSLF